MNKLSRTILAIVTTITVFSISCCVGCDKGAKAKTQIALNIK